LEYDPDIRYTPDMALAHEWILEGLPQNLQEHHLKLVQMVNKGEGLPNPPKGDEHGVDDEPQPAKTKTGVSEIRQP